MQNIFCFVSLEFAASQTFRILQMQFFLFLIKNNNLLTNKIKFENAIQTYSKRCDGDGDTLEPRKSSHLSS